MSVRQNLLEKRNQLEKDLMPDEDAVAADKENEPGQKNFAENKSVRRAFGGVKIVITCLSVSIVGWVSVFRNSVASRLASLFNIHIYKGSQ